MSRVGVALPLLFSVSRSCPPLFMLSDPMSCQVYEFTDTIGSTFSRPGILVLVNDADWELEGEESYQIQSEDNILFVSTLHGG
jgi:hypothetical protein